MNSPVESNEFDKKRAAADYARSFYYRRQLLDPEKHSARLAQMRARSSVTRCGRYRPGPTLPKDLQVVVLTEAVRLVYLNNPSDEIVLGDVTYVTSDFLPLRTADVRRAICEVFLSAEIYSDEWNWLHPEDAGIPATYLSRRWKRSEKLRMRVLGNFRV